MKDCILAGFDKELVALIEEFLEEKEDLKAQIDVLERSLDDSLVKLPVQLTVDEFQFISYSGNIFHKILKFCKQAIIDAFATSNIMRDGAARKIKEALEERTDGCVNVIIYGRSSVNDTACVDMTHNIQFAVRGVRFIFYTYSAQKLF